MFLYADVFLRKTKSVFLLQEGAVFLQQEDVALRMYITPTGKRYPPPLGNTGTAKIKNTVEAPGHKPNKGLRAQIGPIKTSGKPQGPMDP